MTEIYKNRKEAHAWLQKQGFKISQRKFYNDVERGFCVLQPDGSITTAGLSRYMQIGCLHKPAVESAAAAESADAKMREELRGLQLKNERLEHELAVMRGQYVKKTDSEAYAADLAALLDAVPRHLLQLNGARYLAAIGADPQKARTFFELFDRDFTDAVNQICDDGGAFIESENDANHTAD